VTDLPLSRALAPRLEWVDAVASTNSALVVRAAELHDGHLLATDTQTVGRGRLGRSWSTRPGQALAVSVFVATGPEHPVPADTHLGWLPLVAGLAMTRAVRALGVPDAGLKWPNDVLVGGRKISGILAELTPHGVVVGSGLNLTQSADELPVATATSLALANPSDARLPDIADRALSAWLAEWLPLVARWREVRDPAELKSDVEDALHTCGRAVRVDRSGLSPLLGTAVGLDDAGLLLVRDGEGHLTAIAAGDVTHLRYE
jgi:BirA family transcriptional regulator, biotin operon repressor / biotin---[acetyl-CoA-carboxylase] ligase